MAKRRLSKQARERIAAAQRARWAAWKKNGRPAIAAKRTKSGDDPKLVGIMRPAIRAIDKQIGAYQHKIKDLQSLNKALLHLQRL